MSEAKQIPVQMLVDQLQNLREKLGDEAYYKARHDIALEIVLKQNGETFLGNAFPDLDLKPIREEAERRLASTAEPNTPEEVVFNMLKQQFPNLESQAHFNLFMAAFDALRTTLDNYFSGKLDAAATTRKALDKVLDAAADIKTVADNVKEVPEEERTAAMREFVVPAKQFHEYDDQRRLLIELAGIETYSKLNDWYALNKPTMDRVVSPTLRNELFDAIRKRRADLAESLN